jgi:DMSO reductase iron-sulfur subunit
VFARRENEPEYALLRDIECKQVNQYGNPIDTVADNDPLREMEFNINGESCKSDNPNRYKQHGFYFNADNCIACHACEAACSEKNDNPAHIAFRSVGFVESGTYPAYQRINISMACNHCDDPVCLKGCPTRAYTKFAEYGAVLQDPDICFGCGYCTWVCPYNAPQLDPVEGQVTKCNMCVDRLEVGLKPACVTACLGNALDFGVVENVPENRVQAKTEIPGFPRTDISKPNIRFQQTRTPPKRDMHRVDLEPVKYHREEGSDSFKPQLDNKLEDRREWNLGSLLGSHENAHIAFTLSAQTAMGAFVAALLATLSGAVYLEVAASFAPVLVIATLMISFGLYKLNMHLGKPHRFYRGFYNLRHSPVSREIAGVSLFFAGLAAYTLLSLLAYLSIGFPGQSIVMMAFAAISVLGLCAGGYYMYRLYRIEARPFWNHWSTAASFTGTAMTLGSLLVLLVAEFTPVPSGALSAGMSNVLMAAIFAGVALESIGLLAHSNYLRSGQSEGAASWYLQTTRYGNAYWLRNMLLLVAFVLSGVSVANMNTGGDAGLVTYLVLLAVLLTSHVLGRALFYVVVIPTTMPGAFFWKNEGFVEHARQTGLADMPQLGVAYERHHKFDVAALLETIRSTSMKDKYTQLRSIFTG